MWAPSSPNRTDLSGLPQRGVRVGRLALITLAVLALAFSAIAFGPAAVAASRTVPLTIVTATGVHRFEVEEAVTEAEREYGLMNRTEMADDHGMIFRFDSVRPVDMWMKDTRIALDMVFVRADGTIAGVHANAVPMSEAIIASPEPVAFVVELNAGTAARISARTGDRIETRLVGGKGGH